MLKKGAITVWVLTGLYAGGVLFDIRDSWHSWKPWEIDVTAGLAYFPIVIFLVGLGFLLAGLGEHFDKKG